MKKGVPNYYGEQRFGIQGGNLALAEQLFSGGGIEDRKIRGLALSASRSFLFNLQVDARVKAGTFNQISDWVKWFNWMALVLFLKCHKSMTL